MNSKLSFLIDAGFSVDASVEEYCLTDIRHIFINVSRR